MFSIHPANPQCGDPRKFWRGFVFSPKITPYLLHRVWSPCVWDGGRRREQNFVFAGWGALDFDDGIYTLEQAKADWHGCVHVIGTTKSHQVAKNGGAACDRFRILFPWEELIRDLRRYRYTMHKLVSRYGADEKCIDGARFYWPCKEIVSLSTAGKAMGVASEVHSHFEKPIPTEVYAQRVNYQRENYEDGLPPYIYNFLYHGQLFGSQQSRNVCCYTSARFLLEIGWSRQRVLSTLLDTPFSRQDFKEQEIHAAVASAERSISHFLRTGVSKNESCRGRRKTR